MAAKNIQQLAENFMKSSSEKDFVELYRRIKPGLLNHCKSILPEVEVAEDAVSNTMAKIWTKIAQYNPERGNFSTWAYNIARNESLGIKKDEDRYMPIFAESVRNEGEDDFLPKESISIFDENSLYENDFTSNSENELEELYGSVLEKMKDLPEIYKDILYDREINKMKYQEIADKHGMKKRAIATRIRRARLKVKDMFPGITLVFND
jgi:RNA polymerase sigma factor (sigma-70 family)